MQELQRTADSLNSPQAVLDLGHGLEGGDLVELVGQGFHQGH